jgi:hypothetical protein
MFWSCVIFIHAPWPIHNALDFFQFRIVIMYFYIEFWRFHRHSPAKNIFKVLKTKNTHGDVKEVLFFHSH